MLLLVIAALRRLLLAGGGGVGGGVEVNPDVPTAGEAGPAVVGADGCTWTQHNDSYGNVYWYNTTTGASSWDDPSQYTAAADPTSPQQAAVYASPSSAALSPYSHGSGAGGQWVPEYDEFYNVQYRNIATGELQYYNPDTECVLVCRRMPALTHSHSVCCAVRCKRRYDPQMGYPTWQDNTFAYVDPSQLVRPRCQHGVHGQSHAACCSRNAGLLARCV